MFANLLIALREGLEAALVVSIIVAYLVKADRRDALPKLWLGVGLAALIPLVAGAIMIWGPKTLTFQAQEILGGTLSFVAVGMVTWMIFWMGKNARELKGELEGSLSKSLSAGSSGWGVVWIAVVAVGREGVETALFVWATVRSSIETSTVQATVGVIAGLAIAIVLGVLIYQGAVRINLRVFFAVTGYFLVVVAAGIVAYGFGDLQEAGLLPGIMSHAWDLSLYLPDGASPFHWLYVLLQAMFQLNLQPTVLQVVGWWVYIVPTLVLLTLQITGRWPSPARAVAAPATPAAVSADESADADAEEPADVVAAS
ncbi:MULTISPECIES: iron uptake transporter permease EfeU [Actinomyces]|uniref:Iron transporter n=1 Tax=Actinomyces oris TaxID=544580 RepID=A0A1Q8VXR7_9ACTO|nr:MULTISPECIES: iron uptake transporter permease EfeU [Actinomyces]OFR47367.1 iron transporter [Actinomyces sp. HMSC075C01]OLO53092.1 iron transporter [Actinomyces oris]OLO56651.1 iron transporter [Actinomyces oris]